MTGPKDMGAHQAHTAQLGLDADPKAWQDIAEGLFGLLYHPGARFEEAVQVQARFLLEHL